MSAPIEALNLSKTYKGGKRPALDGVSLQVFAGEVLGVIGPNGSGKTTLMGLLLGLLRPDGGQALLSGLPPTQIAAKSKVGYLPERLRFDAWMTGWAFLEYHHALSGLPKGGRDGELADLLKKVGLPEAAWRRPIRGYSRGMLQRIGMAQALVGQPRCLFLDEPTSGMDPEGAIEAREIIRGFAQGGGAVLINSHQLDQVSRICDKVAFLEDGKLRETKELTPSVGNLRYRMRFLTARNKGVNEARLRAALTRLGAEVETLEKDELHLRLKDERHAAAIIAVLSGRGWRIAEAAPAREDLEALFRKGKP